MKVRLRYLKKTSNEMLEKNNVSPEGWSSRHRSLLVELLSHEHLGLFDAIDYQAILDELSDHCVPIRVLLESA